MLAFSNDYYGFIFRVTQSVELFCTYLSYNLAFVVGGVIDGGITYLSFKPCCDKLKDSLRDTLLSNPEYHPTKEETIIIDTIEIQEM